MRRAAAALVLLLCASSCIAARLAEMESAFTSQLGALDERTTMIEVETDEQYADLNAKLDSGAITFEQYEELADKLDRENELAYRQARDAAKAEAERAAKAALEGVKDDLQDTKRVAAGAVETVTRVGAGALGLGQWGDMAAAAVLGAFGLNSYRNRKRRQRGEATT